MIQSLKITNFEEFQNLDLSIKSLNILDNSLVLDILRILKGQKEIETKKETFFSLEIDNQKLDFYFYNNKPIYNTESNIKTFNELIGGFNYLSNTLIQPTKIHKLQYELSAFPNFGLDGSNVFNYLKNNELDITWVNYWLSRLKKGLQINFEIKYNKVYLGYKFSKIGYSKTLYPKDLDNEIFYFSLYLISLLISEEDEILIIKTPEKYLSSVGQIELGKLLSIAANKGIQLFIETKSMCIRDAIKKQIFNKSIDKVNVESINI